LRIYFSRYDLPSDSPTHYRPSIAPHNESSVNRSPRNTGHASSRHKGKKSSLDKRLRSDSPVSDGFDCAKLFRNIAQDRGNLNFFAPNSHKRTPCFTPKEDQKLRRRMAGVSSTNLLGKTLTGCCETPAMALSTNHIFSANNARGAKRPKNLRFFSGAHRSVIGKHILSSEKPPSQQPVKPLKFLDRRKRKPLRDGAGKGFHIIFYFLPVPAKKPSAKSFSPAALFPLPARSCRLSSPDRWAGQPDRILHSRPRPYRGRLR
jgi:hypothetical protein